VYSESLELVLLVQCGLCIYGVFPQEFVDGLICDVTESSIKEWRDNVAKKIFIDDYSDGIFGPSSVSSILGLLLGARYRLRICGISAPKDPFDISGWFVAVLTFKKQQMISNKTKYLDINTLQRLHEMTAKGAQRFLGSKVMLWSS
jgi:hypothetical protein